MNNYDHKDPEVLQKLYHEKNYSLEKIGELCNVHRQTVYYWMKKHGIERADRQKRVEIAKKKRPTYYGMDDGGYEVWRTYLGKGEYRARLPVHRLMAVAKYGISEVKNKVVHHRNGIPWDNRYDNIEIMTDKNHKKLHAKENEYFLGNKNV